MAKTKRPLAQAPLDELAAELGRRRAALPKLRARREKIREELGALESEIAALEALGGGPRKTPAATRSAGTGARKGKGKGSPRPGTLREKISKILGQDPMRPAEIAAGLVEKGLHQGGKALNIQVSTTLAKFDEFSRVARGQWIRKD